jgi:hypothetical protein
MENRWTVFSDFLNLLLIQAVVKWQAKKENPLFQLRKTNPVSTGESNGK